MKERKCTDEELLEIRRNNVSKGRKFTSETAKAAGKRSAEARKIAQTADDFVDYVYQRYGYHLPNVELTEDDIRRIWERVMMLPLDLCRKVSDEGNPENEAPVNVNGYILSLCRFRVKNNDNYTIDDLEKFLNRSFGMPMRKIQAEVAADELTFEFNLPK